MQGDPHTLLLLRGDSLKDSSMYNVPIANYGVIVSDVQSKFSGRSLYFNGKSRIEYPSKETGLCTSDWTVDWWEYSQSGTKPRLSTLTKDSGKYGLTVIGNGTVWGSTNGSSWAFESLKFIDAENGVWNHRAIVKKDNVITTYKNGKKVSSVAITGNIYCTDGRSTLGCNRELSNYYTGFIEKFRISDIARWLDEFNPEAELPVEYQEVPEIISNEEAYIDTGVICSNKIRAKITVKSKREGVLFGYRKSPDETNIGVFALPGNLIVDYNSSSYKTYRASTSMNTVTAPYTVEVSKAKRSIVLDNGEVISNEVLCQDIFTGGNLWLLKMNGNGAAIKGASPAISACKIYEDEVLVRDFVPCYRKADNVVGMYDLVGQKFYTNAGQAS